MGAVMTDRPRPPSRKHDRDYKHAKGGQAATRKEVGGLGLQTHIKRDFTPLPSSERPFDQTAKWLAVRVRPPTPRPPGRQLLGGQDQATSITADRDENESVAELDRLLDRARARATGAVRSGETGCLWKWAEPLAGTRDRRCRGWA